MSHQVGVSCIHQTDTYSNSKVSAGSEATQQNSQGTPRPLTTCWVPMDLCCEVRSQGVIKVRLEEFIRTKQTMIWPCEGRALHRYGGTHRVCKGQMAPVSELHNWDSHNSSQISLGVFHESLHHGYMLVMDRLETTNSLLCRAQSQQGRATGSQEDGAGRFPVGGQCWSCVHGGG